MGREKTYFMLYNISQYKETIKIMMRHGGIVSNMAKKLGYPEKELVNYIKAEGLDIELSRRGWEWKNKRGSKGMKRRRVRARKVGSVRWKKENQS